MRPDIITATTPDNAHAARVVEAIAHDIDAGLVPQWIGAIVVTVCADGQWRMTYIERERWIMAKLEQQIGLN